MSIRYVAICPFAHLLQHELTLKDLNSSPSCPEADKIVHLGVQGLVVSERSGVKKSRKATYPAIDPGIRYGRPRSIGLWGNCVHESAIMTNHMGIQASRLRSKTVIDITYVSQACFLPTTMTLTIQQSTPPPPGGMFNEYHLKIIGARNRMRTKQYGQQKINAFLTDLFDNDLDGMELEEAPLEYSGHAFNEDPSNASHNVLLVKLRLTKHAAEASMTLDEAAARLCRVMFHPEFNGILGTLTTNGLLGISAVSEPFKQYWTQTMFRDCLRYGPRLLRRIDRDFYDNSLPECLIKNTADAFGFWRALALSFAVVAGLNFEVFASSVPGSFDPIAVFGTVGITHGSSILRKYMQNNSYVVAEQERAWTHCYTELLSSLQAVSGRLKEATGPVTIGTNTLPQHKELCNALYEVTLIAAKTFTSKQDIFDEFVKLRNEAAFRATGVAAAVALTHLSSAFTLATTIQAVPLASWGLVDVVGFLTGGGAPLVYSTTLSVSWPIAIATLGFSAFFSMKEYRNQKLKERTVYARRIIAVIGQAWGFAHDIHILLRWIHLMDASVPGPMRFVDDNAEAEWAQFIRSTRAAAGGNATEADLGPQAVSAYLYERLQSWSRLHEALIEDE